MTKAELLAALQELARVVDDMHASDEVTRALVKADMANKTSDAYRRARRVIRAAQLEMDVA
jgi:hypothetical protein